MDYKESTDEEDKYSAIGESDSSNSSEKSVSAHMTGSAEEMAKRFEEQALIQKMQHDMLMAQQKSIGELKSMMALLLEQSKKKKSRSSSAKPGSSKGKGKEPEP